MREQLRSLGWRVDAGCTRGFCLTSNRPATKSKVVERYVQEERAACRGCEH